MNKKKKYKRARKRFSKLASAWTKRLGLAWWRVDVFYYDKAPKRFKRKHGRQVAAKMIARWEYMSAEMHVNLPFIAEMTKDEMEHVIVHELCHALVNEMREEGHKHEERVCTRLTQAFLWTKSGV